MNALEAHKRLMKLLPVSTHICRDHKSRTNIGRPVFFKGVRYPSVTAAAKANGTTKQSIFNRIRKGQDCYYEVDD